MIKLIPISQSQIDWKSYLELSNEVLQSSPTATLDARWHKLNRTLADYLATLKEITIPGADPYENAGALLNHVHISFMLVAPKLVTIEIIMNAKVDFTIVETKLKDFSLSILSGTLTQWRSTVINCCIDDIQPEVRMFGSLLVDYFEKAQIYQLMKGLMKIPMIDGTIRLK